MPYKKNPAEIRLVSNMNIIQEDGPGYLDLGKTMNCTWCGGINLHHDRIMVFDRAEDEKQTRVIEVEDGIATAMALPSEQTRNPSDRRHGLTIRFWCEGCDGITELAIQQHKGSSYLQINKAGQRMVLPNDNIGA